MSATGSSTARTKTFLLAVLTIGAIIFAGIFFYSFQKENITQRFKAFTIKRHTVLYDGTIFTPEFVVIHLGDTVAIKNNSQTPMSIAVGRHENHKTLNGFQEKIINSKQEYTFTPQEKGVFDIHDHLNPKKLGYLVVDN